MTYKLFFGNLRVIYKLIKTYRNKANTQTVEKSVKLLFHKITY